jgi:serine phosphatase RsbU (regulator of sigma subunit)
MLPAGALATRILKIALVAEPSHARAARAGGAAEGGGAEHAPGADGPGSDARELGRSLQRAMLPRNAPRVPGYDIAAGTTVEDAGRGSSVWDALPLPDGRWALAVFDVRGGGQPPALLLGMARAALRTAVSAGGELGEILARANGGLASVLDQGQQFVECALVAPDAEGVEWASAGRPPAGVLGRAGTLAQLASQGPPLGMLEGFRYTSERAAMGVGDALLVLSAGSAGLFRGAADLVVQVQERTAGEVVATVHRGLRAALDDPSSEVSVLFLRKH